MSLQPENVGPGTLGGDKETPLYTPAGGWATPKYLATILLSESQL
jgi:hypothetical protein